MTAIDQPATRYAARHRLARADAPIVPGYDVIEPLGAGGSASVWAAEGPSGLVAIKLLAAVDVDEALVELSVLARVHGPHLVRVQEALALPSGEVAIVMDHLGGGSLSELLAARGYLSQGEAVTVLSPVASALGQLHRSGVCHGDISPGNVLFDTEARPYLTDLGLARLAGASGADGYGTEGFIAPELYLGSRATAASDLYAVGALAWLLLTGAIPEGIGIRGRLQDQPVLVDTDLAQVIEAALSVEPQDRPDADEFAAAIFAACPAEPVELVRGGDELSLLTRRIREAAGASPRTPLDAALPDAPARRGGLLRRVRSQLSRSSPSRARTPSLPQASRVSRPSPRPVSGASTSGLRPVIGGRTRNPHARRYLSVLRAAFPQGRTDALQRIALAAIVALILGGAGTVALALANARSVDDGAVGSSATPKSPSDRRPASTDDLRTVPEAPQKRPRDLVQALADARARAWSLGVAAALVEVDAPGSAALARDTEVLAGVQRAGQRYVDLAFEVREATLISETENRASITAQIDTGAHTIKGPQGVQQRAASSPAPVVLDLVFVESGWRVQEVRAG